ncbi:MAG TPA: hypothetical protein PLP62_12050 [Flavobacteriaceae bacterium]|nr:hypothetical protein [Flavobacteriaceae bacterium]MCB9213676.1 hypothetical protein [Alteromonas sp.]HPF12178.1 hypothetical protein [Flavobacteriaceae bacterium]HRW44954.1 hypothetical protein [Flavobacteriaceae bacterium]
MDTVWIVYGKCMDDANVPKVTKSDEKLQKVTESDEKWKKGAESGKKRQKGSFPTGTVWRCGKLGYL